MNDLRVKIRGAALWFALGGLLGFMAVIAGVFARGSYAWVGPAILGLLAAAPVAWGLCGAKRFIEFGDAIVIHYFLKQRRIPWNEVSFVSFDRTEGALRTGVPFVSIPTENHIMTIRLRDGRTLGADVEPDQIAPIQQVVNQRASLDVEGEQRRVEAEMVSDHKFNLILHAVMGFVFSAMGIYFAYSMFGEIKDGTDSANWPEAPGTIVSSSYTSETTSGRRGRTKVIYKPALRYTFEVEGKEYASERMQFSPINSEDPQEIQALVNQLPRDTAVKVRYKPSDPSIAVLIPGIGTERYVFFAVLIVVGIGALVYAIINLFRYQRSRQLLTAS